MCASERARQEHPVFNISLASFYKMLRPFTFLIDCRSFCAKCLLKIKFQDQQTRKKKAWKTNKNLDERSWLWDYILTKAETQISKPHAALHWMLVASGDAARAVHNNCTCQCGPRAEFMTANVLVVKTASERNEKQNTPQDPQKPWEVLKYERRRKARAKNFILGDFWVYKWSFHPGWGRVCS